MEYDAYLEMRYLVMYPEPSTVMQGSMVAPGSDFLTVYLKFARYLVLIIQVTYKLFICCQKSIHSSKVG
ncbi:hypothetical protein SAMN05421863_102256 [Nitrosomonas communis]|uniref:Uncharacterized protein n=1 Tax=Nitrosomonas communis TaxID=44574 RepID=A0A1I4PTL3_9PROT|nr:hypothetical protein SAMN05421863_102256 [Nitrosomonas communis]